MAKVHELLLKIRSSFDGKFGENVQKITKGFQSVEKQTVKLQNSQEKLKNLQVQVKGYEKVQNQILGTKLKSEALTEQISQFKESLSGVEQGSKYKEIEKSIKSLEKEQLKATIQTQKFEQQSKIVSNQLKNEGISTNKLSSEKAKLITKNKDLKEKMDKLTESQEKNRKKTKEQASGFAGLSLATKVALASIALVATTAGVALKTGFSEAMNMEGYRLTLQTVMKDSLKAKELLSWGSNFANVTPFENAEVVDGIVKLQSYGMKAKEVLPQVGDMAAVMGKSLDQGVEAIADAQTGELERLKEFGLTKNMIIDEAAKLRLGLVVNKKGQITDQEKFNKAMFTLMNEKFKGGMAKQATTMKGIWSTITGITKSSLMEIVGVTQEGTIKQGSAYELLKHKVQKFGNVLTKWQSDGTVKNVAKNLTSGLNVTIGIFTNLFEKTNKIYNFFKTNWPLIGPIVTGLSTTIGVFTVVTKAASWWAKIATGSTKLWALAQKGLNFVFKQNPIALTIAIIAGLTVGVIYAYKHSEKFRNIVHKLWGKMKDFGSYVMSLPEKIKGVWDGFIDKTQVLWEKIKKLIEPLKTAAEWVGKLFSGGDKNITLTTNTKNTTSGTGTPYTPYTGTNIFPKSKAIPNAKGSIVTGPTYALVGEAGDEEVIVPINNSPRSKSLVNYAFNAINGNKKSPFESGSLNFKSGSTTQVNNDSQIQVIVQVTVQGIADTVEKAKQIGSAAGTAAAESFEKKYNEMKRNERRLSLG